MLAKGTGGENNQVEDGHLKGQGQTEKQIKIKLRCLIPKEQKNGHKFCICFITHLVWFGTENRHTVLYAKAASPFWSLPPPCHVVLNSLVLNICPLETVG